MSVERATHRGSTLIVPEHPAVFPDEVLDLALEALLPIMPTRRRDLMVLDPFAGVGGIHKLQGRRAEVNGRGIHTVGVELMPKWAMAHPDTMVGDATALDLATGSFDAVVTSPCYGNRMADHHQAADACKACRGSGEVEPDGTPTSGTRTAVACKLCKGTGLSHRRSYRHYYGDAFFADAPIEQNAGAMHFGDEYKLLHAKAWGEVRRVLRPGGRFVLNIKNHVRDRKVVRVAQWHRRTVLELGFTELWRWDIPLDGYRFGANHGARVRTEQLYVFER